MQWWAFTLTLDDGNVVDWQAAGSGPTDAMRELIYCWLERLGDAAIFLNAELSAIECKGPLVEDETPTQTGEDDDTVEVSAIGQSSKMRVVKLLR
jgi:hypothetical protein